MEEIQEIPNNSAAVTEQAPSTQVTDNGTGGQETPAQTTALPQDTQGKQEDTFFDANNLAPELQAAYKNMQAAYTKKTQEIADVKKKAESLDELVKYEPFMNWYNQHRQGTDNQVLKQDTPKQEQIQAKPPEEMDPEVYASIIQDPKKFNEYVKKLALEAAGPIAMQAQQKAEMTMNLMKVEKFGQEHPEFWELDRKGLIEPLIDKYPGLELEDYFKLARYPFLEQDAIRKAHGVVQDKKNAVSEKPGAVIPASRRVKVGSREEAMSLAWEAHERGQTPPDFEF